jgi:hypothetical protein
MKRLVFFVVAGVLAACGPSASEVRTAKLAQYSASPVEMLHIAVDVAREANYKIGDLSEERLEMITQPKFFSHEGDLESPGADGFVSIRPGSVQVSFIVRVVLGDMNRTTVTVTPKTFESVQGSPKPRELMPDDPYLPPWVLGRADALTLAIYERAKPYAMASQ